MRPLHRMRSLCALMVPSLMLLHGCASTNLDASWVDPQLAPGLLRGARVMVACEAHEVVLKQVCQDQLAAEVTARGGTPLPLGDTGSPGPGRAPVSEQLLASARAAGAKAVLVHAVTIADVASGGGMSLSIGGMSIGGSGGVGVGVSMPVGTPRTHNGYAIESRITDAQSGRVLFTAKASARPSADTNAQLAELTRAVFAAAEQAKAF
ncbi:MAG: hypothetical protein JNJ42_05095 [Burkholderiaceae bacterium]|nr:hypothetical protein [Burkholderiaceae bacterium]